jgi:GNAT superfamily N-acetyltransferase
VPGLADAALARELSRLGFAPSGFHAALIAAPRPSPQPADGVEVEHVRDAQAFDDFLNTYAAGWGVPQRDQFKRNVRPWLDQPGWSLFLGRIGGKPAAQGILYVDGATAYLADASTDPDFRGRGLHAALLNARLAAAAEIGADVAASGAAFLSTSHRNMERAGMRLQFVRALWAQDGVPP